MQQATISIPQFTKTRIAPTPSGFLHLGNIFSFVITIALARKTGAKITLRIDDLDRERVNLDCLQDIFDTLNFLELPWDEGPCDVNDFDSYWSQVHRIDLYNGALNQLKESGKIFACDCSRSKIKQQNRSDIYPGTCRDKAIPLGAKETNWRLVTDEETLLEIRSLARGKIESHLPTDMQYFSVKKKDGFPSYQLASLIDDVHFGTDLIVRGKDLWPSTLAQLYLARQIGATGFKNSTFHHHQLLTEANGSKLSKSAGATSVRYLRQNGKTPEDIFTMIARMLGHEIIVDNWEQLSELIE
jgi:glutamyl/glutaminyl-tRNA synthetase